MKIILAEHYGLCFGVRDAITKAEQLAKQGPLTVLGELVHNPVVRERLAERGVQEASQQDAAEIDGQAMITAHGTSDSKREQWRQSGMHVADGTCPLVQYAHEQLRSLVEQGYHPVVIGKPGHVEVEGLIGDFPEACVVENAGDAMRLPDRERYGVISQTTQSIETARRLLETIRMEKPGSEVRFIDTICQPTKNRQNALRKLIAECDTVVVVGGHNSNNTLQLVAAALIAGRRVFHIERDGELDPTLFYNSEIVGITAGTSTLKETVAAVYARLQQIANASEQPVLTV